VCGTGRKARSNVFLAFVDDVFLELLTRITWQIAIELVKQIHHRGRDYRLMKRLVGHLGRLLYKIAGVEVVFERATGNLGQLAIVAVGKNCEILAAGGQVRR